jgi:hypothetical protein
MRRRCYDPQQKRWADYGGRGITVCDRWNESFLNFLADMGPMPSPQHSVERRDNSQAYCPENCYWASSIEQARNTRRSLSYTYQGTTRTLPEWCEVLGVSYDRMYCRLRLYGYTFEEAVTLPNNPRLKTIKRRLTRLVE